MLLLDYREYNYRSSVNMIAKKIVYQMLCRRMNNIS